MYDTAVAQYHSQPLKLSNAIGKIIGAKLSTDFRPIIFTSQLSGFAIIIGQGKLQLLLIVSPTRFAVESFIRRKECNMAYHCGHFTMGNYLWTFTCGYFTLLHVVLFVHFTLFHVVPFDQSLTAFRLLCQLTHQLASSLT
jgi:hypothetical protein